MDKKKALMIALAAAAALLALIFGELFFIEPKGGTPIIIKGGGDPGEALTVMGPGEHDQTVSGDISSIKITADGKCWTYKTPYFSYPLVELVTKPTDCNIATSDEWFDVGVRFDPNKIKWKTDHFETTLCTITTLNVTPNDTVGKTSCVNPDGSTNCLQSFDVSAVKKLEIHINDPSAQSCP
jgi:hypothetical protein